MKLLRYTRVEIEASIIVLYKDDGKENGNYYLSHCLNS